MGPFSWQTLQGLQWSAATCDPCRKCLGVLASFPLKHVNWVYIYIYQMGNSHLLCFLMGNSHMGFLGRNTWPRTGQLASSQMGVSEDGVTYHIYKPKE